MLKKPLTRVVAAVATLAAVATSLVACGSGEARSLLDSIHSGHVILGTKYDQVGLGLRTPTKDLTGLDTDVARYVVNTIADKNGWDHPTVSWKETPSAQRETLIGNGEVDMIAATYSINAGRAKKVDFAGPYLVTHQALLVRADSSGITKLQDLSGHQKLCSVSGSTPAQKVKSALPNIQLQEFDSYSSCVEALHQKKVDAMTTDATILYGYSMQYPGEFKVIPLTKDDGTPWTNEYYGIGLAKGDTASRDAVNEVLEEMYSSGEFEKMLKANLGDIPLAKAGTGGESLVEEGTPGDLSFLDKK